MSYVLTHALDYKDLPIEVRGKGVRGDSIKGNVGGRRTFSRTSSMADNLKI